MRVNDDIACCTLAIMHYDVHVPYYRKPQTAKTKNGIQDWHLGVCIPTNPCGCMV